MSLALALSMYLNLNLLIVIGFVGLGALSWLSRKLRNPMSSSVELKLHYLMLLAIFSMTMIQPLLPRNEIFTPAAKVWSAESIKSFGREYSAADQGGYLSWKTPQGNSVLRADQVIETWISILVFLFAVGGSFLLRDLLVLFRIKRKSYLIRKIGNTRIFVNDSMAVPFSYWLPGQANIAIPSLLLAKPEEYKIALAHELQHHRHGDTKWVYVIWLMRLVCVVNPAIHLWNRWITEIQEFACDETLLGRKKVDSQIYARCLVEVAQQAIDQKYAPVCATGLTFLTERHLLKRRIEKMLSKSSSAKNWKVGIGIGLLLATAMGATAVAAKGLVQDRRVNLTQAKTMAEKAQAGSEFPVTVNAAVVKQLNRFIGTPEGRELIRNSLARMQEHKAIVSERLLKYGVPSEILALPIVESGYQNLPMSENPNQSAGIWQFIPATARIFELTVNDQKDERLDVARETDAAARYLQSNHLRFNDWQLSILAYNMGEKGLQAAIDKTGSRDAWTLISKGYEGDKDYLAKLMAAILIMKNPESVN